MSRAGEEYAGVTADEWTARQRMGHHGTGRRASRTGPVLRESMPGQPLLCAESLVFAADLDIVEFRAMKFHSFRRAKDLGAVHVFLILGIPVVRTCSGSLLVRNRGLVVATACEAFRAKASVGGT